MELNIEGQGLGTIKCFTNSNKENILTVKNVLYVPDLCGSLLSIKRILNSDFQINFKDHTCLIEKNNIKVAVANCVGDLYKLRTDHKSLLVSTNHKDNCIHRWHSKLDHKDPDALQRIPEEDLAEGVEIDNCGIKETCIKHASRVKLHESPSQSGWTRKLKIY